MLCSYGDVPLQVTGQAVMGRWSAAARSSDRIWVAAREHRTRSIESTCAVSGTCWRDSAYYETDVQQVGFRTSALAGSANGGIPFLTKDS